MKKSLFALAAVGAFAGAAQAQSSVTVYGNLDIGATQVTNSTKAVGGTDTKYNTRTTGNGDGALSTSLIGFRGTEDLGKGMRATFRLEYDLIDVGTGGNGNSNQTTTAGAADTTIAQNQTSTGVWNGFGARYSFVGLEGGFGTVRLGRQENTVHSVMTNGLAGGANNSIGSMYSEGSNGASENRSQVRPYGVFVNRAITYIAPTVSGFTVEAQTANQSISSETTAATAANTSVSVTSGSVKFTGIKNLSVAYGMTMYDLNGASTINTTADTKRRVQIATAQYNFGPVVGFLAAAENKTNTAAGALTTKDTLYEFGLRAPLTPVISAWASGYTGSRASDTATSRADLSGYQLGLTYAFSKRTSAYGIFGTQSIKATEVSAASSTSKVESTGMAVGIRHTF
jgi:predicted porin